jgi:hypothetical protein
MLEVELDIFSGMPNPTWMLSEPQERRLLELLRSEPAQISPVRTMSQRLGLGYRGVMVRRIKMDDGRWDKAMSAARKPFPDEFRLGLKRAKGDSAADWLLTTAGPQGAAISDELLEVAYRGVKLVPRSRGPIDPSAKIDRRRVEEAEVAADVPYEIGAEDHETWWACPSNYFWANAQFFNDPAHVTRNNCYCFASNHRADVRYARPGQRAGRPAQVMSCGSVVDGLRADGWKDGCEPNALTIVLVIWPNYDYHFYRLVTGGPYWWWGHKPGGTPAKYTDDCGHAIFQYQGRGYAPNNICRGGYTDFCGYFYQNNWTAFVA